MKQEYEYSTIGEEKYKFNDTCQFCFINTAGIHERKCPLIAGGHLKRKEYPVETKEKEEKKRQD